MSNAVISLAVLYENAFIHSSAFPAFYDALGYKRRSLLLSYLVLPLCLYSPSQAFLRNAKSTSSLRTMLAERERIIGLDARINAMRATTNLSVNYLLLTGFLSLTGDVDVVVNDDRERRQTEDGVAKLAAKLGALLAPFDVVTIYRTLGVREICVQ